MQSKTTAVAYNDVACWERIRRSITARIDQLVLGIREEILKDGATAELIDQFRRVGSTRPRLVDGAPQFYRILEAKADELVQKAYDTCQDVLVEKGELNSVESLRTIWTYAIGPFIQKEIPVLLRLLAGIGPNDDNRVSVNLANGYRRIGGNLYTNWQRELVLEPVRATISPAQPIAAPASGADFSDTSGERGAPSPAPIVVAVSEPGDWTVLSEENYTGAPEASTPQRAAALAQKMEPTLSEPKTPIQALFGLSAPADVVASGTPVLAESAPTVLPTKKAKERSDPEMPANIVARKRKDPSGNPTMTVKEAAHALSKSASTIYRWITEDKLKWSPIRGRILTESVLSLLNPQAE
jgi:hypothetical protein